MQAFVEQVRNTQKQTAGELRSMGYQVVTTRANFLLVKVDDAPGLVRFLAKRSVLVRDRSSLPQMEGYVRVTVGTPDQMRRFVEVMAEAAASGLQ